MKCKIILQTRRISENHHLSLDKLKLHYTIQKARFLSLNEDKSEYRERHLIVTECFNFFLPLFCFIPIFDKIYLTLMLKLNFAKFRKEKFKQLCLMIKSKKKKERKKERKEEE